MEKHSVFVAPSFIILSSHFQLFLDPLITFLDLPFPCSVCVREISMCVYAAYITSTYVSLRYLSLNLADFILHVDLPVPSIFLKTT